MVIEQPTHRELRYAISDQEAAHFIQTIGHKAWTKSDWLQQLARLHDLEPSALAARAFDPKNNDKVKQQFNRVQASGHMGRQVVYWLGETMKPWPEHWDGNPATLPDNLFSYGVRGWPHGFAKIEQQGRQGGRLAQTAQRVANIGIWVCLHDLDVLPEHQGKGLGTAMAYVGLSDQPQRLPSSLYTPLANAPMRAWAEKYGYTLREEYIDTELLGDVAVDFGHYVANSVGAVRERMEAAQPWLTQGNKVSVFARKLA
jgi:GNAT superfamily N-acetyltransferase